MKISENLRRCDRVLLAFVLAAGGMACDERRPTDPSPPSQPSPPAPPPSTFVVRGHVFEHTPSGMRPVAGVPLRVFKGYGQYPEIVDVTSGADGAYEAGVIERQSFARVQVPPHSSFRAPCPPYAWGEDRFDVHVVSRAILSTTGIPPSFPTNSLQPSQNFYFRVQGVVTERIGDDARPLPAATVALLHGAPGEFGEDTYGADTLADANGRYLLCWVGNSEISGHVEARKEGYAPASKYGAPGYEPWNLDFELTR